MWRALKDSVLGKDNMTASSRSHSRSRSATLAASRAHDQSKSSQQVDGSSLKHSENLSISQASVPELLHSGSHQTDHIRPSLNVHVYQDTHTLTATSSDAGAQQSVQGQPSQPIATNNNDLLLPSDEEDVNSDKNKIAEMEVAMHNDRAHYRSKVQEMKDQMHEQHQLIGEYKREIARYRDSLHQKDQVLRDTQTKLVQLSNTVETPKEALAAAAQKIDKLNQSLDQCKEQIFRMQVPQSAPDSQIASRWRQLCSAVEEWTQSAFEDAEDVFVRMATNKAAEESRNLVWKFAGQEELTIAQDHQEANLNMLQAYIVRVLIKEVLDRNGVCLGINEQANGILQQLLGFLKEVDPPRDNLAIQTWRVDTYRALNAMEEVQTTRCNVINDTTHTIVGPLMTALPDEQDGQDAITNVREFVKSAAALDHIIKLSTSSYRWVVPFLPDDHEKTRVFDHQDLARYDVFDSRTGRKLPPGALVGVPKESQDQRCGEMLTTLMPGLLRDVEGRKEPLTLVKARVLVKFDAKVERKKKEKRARQAEDAGGVKII